MRTTITGCLLIAGLACVATPETGASTPVEVLARLPTLEDAAVSPDGSRVAYVKTVNEDRFIHVISLADKQTLRVLRVAQTRLRRITWADNDNILIIASSSEQGRADSAAGRYFDRYFAQPTLVIRY